MEMKIKLRLLLALLVFGLGATAALPVVAQNDKQSPQKQEQEDNDDDENLSAADKALVKVSLEDARATALKRVPGKVVDEELEKENGRLQYAFDIRTAEGKLFDVEIDAVTGEVLQAEPDDDDDDDGDATSKTVKSKANAKIKAAQKVPAPKR